MKQNNTTRKPSVTTEAARLMGVKSLKFHKPDANGNDTEITMTKELMDRIKADAKRAGVSPAAVITRAMEAALGLSGEPSQENGEIIKWANSAPKLPGGEKGVAITVGVPLDLASFMHLATAAGVNETTVESLAREILSDYLCEWSNVNFVRDDMNLVPVGVLNGRKS